MVVVREVVRDNGLDFTQQRKVMILRAQGLSFKKIAAKVRNLKKKPTTEDTVRRVFARFSVKKGM